MHETIIAKKIVEQAEQAGAKSAIEVEVGQLSELSPEEVEEGLKKITPWKIHIQYKEGKVKCDCGYEGKAKVVEKGHGYCLFNCPACSKKPKVLEGGEIKIIGVD